MTLSLVLGHDAEVSAFVADQLGLRWAFQPPFVTIGVARDGALVGGVVYTRFNGVSIEITAAASDQRWLNRSILETLFAYPFRQLDVVRIEARCDAENGPLRHMMRRLGFDEEARLERGWHTGGDAILFRQFAEDCPWLRDDAAEAA